jgi:hypothetical protein
VPPFSVVLKKRGIDLSVHRLGEGAVFEERNPDQHQHQRHIAWTDEEDSFLIRQFVKKGLRRRDVAKLFAGQTWIEVKSRWHAVLRHGVAEVRAAGIDTDSQMEEH